MMDSAPPAGPSVRQVVEVIAARQDAKFWIERGRDLNDSISVRILLSEIARTL
jgi:hypothetical protein